MTVVIPHPQDNEKYLVLTKGAFDRLAPSSQHQAQHPQLLSSNNEETSTHLSNDLLSQAQKYMIFLLTKPYVFLLFLTKSSIKSQKI
ncbi:hypothetical protein ACGO3R_13220 [Lactococcus lactis]